MVAPAYFASMTPKIEKTALITGASGGIGYELAKLFAAEGYNLVLVARSKDKLEKHAEEMKRLGSPAVTVLAKDLAELDAPEEIYKETERAGITVDVLVNNAGFGARGPFLQSDLDDDLDMMQLNMVALTHMTKLYLPQMVARAASGRPGRIMQVASTAAFQPGPFMAVYYASKAYVLSFSEALYEELQGTGVTVTCLCPGATTTGFAERAQMTDVIFFKKGAMDAKTVAQKGYRALMAGKPIAITGAKNWLSAQSVRLGPRALVRKIVRKAQE